MALGFSAVLLFHGVASVYDYLSYEYSNYEVENTIPKNPQICPKNKTKQPPNKHQQKRIPHRSHFWLQRSKGQNEDIVHEISDEADHPQRGRTASPDEVGVET